MREKVLVDTQAAGVVAQEILNEYISARSIHQPMHSAHEGYAVIKEELDELWDEVKKKHPDRKRLLAEAIQIGAMAIAFAVEVSA